MKDRVFRALADPTRRRILEMLAKRDLTAGQIAGGFPMAFPSISHHLSVLRGARLVASEREGRHIRYRLDTTVYRETLRYLAGLFSGGRRV